LREVGDDEINEILERLMGKGFVGECLQRNKCKDKESNEFHLAFSLLLFLLLRCSLCFFFAVLPDMAWCLGMRQILPPK